MQDCDSFAEATFAKLTKRIMRKPKQKAIRSPTDFRNRSSKSHGLGAGGELEEAPLNLRKRNARGRKAIVKRY